MDEDEDDHFQPAYAQKAGGDAGAELRLCLMDLNHVPGCRAPVLQQGMHHRQAERMQTPAR